MGVAHGRISPAYLSLILCTFTVTMAELPLPAGIGSDVAVPMPTDSMPPALMPMASTLVWPPHPQPQVGWGW